MYAKDTSWGLARRPGLGSGRMPFLLPAAMRHRSKGRRHHLYQSDRRSVAPLLPTLSDIRLPTSHPLVHTLLEEKKISLETFCECEYLRSALKGGMMVLRMYADGDVY